MTKKDILKILATIKETSLRDDEYAHVLEDRLRADFIRHVADSNLGDISELAKRVLSTEKLTFARHCS